MEEWRKYGSCTRHGEVLPQGNKGRNKNEAAIDLDESRQQESSFVTIVQLVPVLLNEFPRHLSPFHTERKEIKKENHINFPQDSVSQAVTTFNFLVPLAIKHLNYQWFLFRFKY